MKQIRYLEYGGNDVVGEFLGNLEKKDYGKCERAIDLLEEFGMKLVNSEMVGSVSGHENLWYLRAQFRSNIYRLFFTEYKKFIVLLHGFQKKTQKIPQSEIRIALERKQALFKDD